MPAASAPGTARRGRLVRSATLLLVFGLLANAVGYVYQLAMGRMLGPAAFGVLAAVLAALTLFETLLPALQMNVAYHVAALRQSRPPDALALVARVARLSVVAGFALGAVAWGAVLALSPGTADAGAVAAIVAIHVATWLPASVFVGVLQGEQRFFSLGVVTLAAALARFGLAVALVAGGAGVVGAMGGGAARPTLILVACLALVGAASLRPRPRARALERSFFSLSWLLVFGLLIYAAMTTIDILAAARWFPTEDAGAYAGMAVIGKTILFVSAAAGNVFFPEASERIAEGTDTRPLLARALALVIGISLAATLVLAIAPEMVARLGLGESYVRAAHLLPWMGIAMTLLGAVHLLLRDSMVRRDATGVLLIAAFAGLEVVLLALFHDTLMAIVLGVIASAAGAAVAGAARSFLRGAPRDPMVM